MELPTPGAYRALFVSCAAAAVPAGVAALFIRHEADPTADVAGSSRAIDRVHGRVDPVAPAGRARPCTGTVAVDGESSSHRHAGRWQPGNLQVRSRGHADER